MQVLNQVDCLDLTTLEKLEENIRSNQDKLSEPFDKTTLRLNALRCIAKSLPTFSPDINAPFEPERSLSDRESTKPEHNETNIQNKEQNQPQIVMLPPFEGVGDDDKHDDTQSVEEEPTQSPHSETDSMEDDDLEQEQTDEQSENVESNDRQSKMPSRDQINKNRSRKKTLWDHFKRPLAKLHKGNSTRKISARNSKNVPLKRFKRLTSNVGGLDSNGLVNIIVRALTSTNSGLTSSTLQAADTVDATRNLMQQVLASISIIAQQLVSMLVRQAAADIPRHVLNLGQLFANLLTIMTVENPLIANSPLPLVRSNSTIEYNGISSNLAREQIDSFERSLRLIQQLARETMKSALVLSENMMKRSQTSLTSAATSATPVKLAKEKEIIANNSTKDGGQDGKLIGRIMGLTSDNFKESIERSSSRQIKSNRRVKRSLGTLLLFGPFSKLYMAMIVNRVIKYQSNVLSQAVVGELVRRFIMPSVNLSLGSTTAGVTNLLNQVKQTLGNSVQTGAANNQILQASPQVLTQFPNKLDDINSQDETRKVQKNGFEEKRSARPVIFDADCRLADPGGLELYQDFVNNSSDPKHLLLNFADLNRSAISFDQKGMIIDTPHSKITIPSLQASQQALLKLISGSNGASDFFTDYERAHFPQSRSQPNRPSHHQNDKPFKASQHLFDSHTLHINHSNPLRGTKVALSPYDFGVDTRFNEQTLAGLLSNKSDQSGKILQPSKILSASLSNATSTQLLHLLGQINSQQQQKALMTDEQLLQQLQLINLLGNSTSSNQTNGNNQPPTTLKEPLIANKENSHNMNLSTSAESVAERILNKAFKISHENSNQSSNNNNKLVKDTSDLLGDSFAHIIKGLDFDADTARDVSNFSQVLENKTKDEINSKEKSPIQITLTPENAATLIGELMTSMKKISENSAEIPNIPMPHGIESEKVDPEKGESFLTSPLAEPSNVHTGDIELQVKKPNTWLPELPAQTERESQQILQESPSQNHQPTQLNLPIEHKPVKMNQQALGPNHAASQDIDLVDRIKVGRQKADYNIALNNAHPIAMSSSINKQVRTNRVITTKPRLSQSNSTQYYPGYVQNFAKQLTPDFVEAPSLILEQSTPVFSRNQNMDLFHSSDEKLWRTDTVNRPHVKQIQARPKVESKLVELKSSLSTTIPKLPQQSNNYKRLAKDKTKNKVSQSMPAREVPQASTTINRESTELLDRSQNVNKTQQQQRENLNNIAMALNVMNMVLLSQKLASNNSSDSNAGFTPTSIPRLNKTKRGKLKSHSRRKNVKKTPSNATLSVSKSTNNTTKASNLERENITIPSNHRTSTNIIKPDSKLIVAEKKQNVAEVKTVSSKLGRYSFQPLIVNNPSAGANRSEFDNSGATESDLVYANRWNNVLAHLNLATSG